VLLHAFVEQDPATASSVRLSRTGRDPFGLPLAEVDWVLADSERRSVLALATEVGRFLAERGFGRLDVAPELGADGAAGADWPALFHDNQHHAGTARMAGSERDGVVDTDGRVFGLPNLYVGGGAVFPSGSFANPTLTMVAQAFRLGAHLRAELAATRVAVPPAAIDLAPATPSTAAAVEG
jgi:choline dehydrogenase-like flavoprotein